MAEALQAGSSGTWGACRLEQMAPVTGSTSAAGWGCQEQAAECNACAAAAGWVWHHRGLLPPLTRSNSAHRLLREG